VVLEVLENSYSHPKVPSSADRVSVQKFDLRISSQLVIIVKHSIFDFSPHLHGLRFTKSMPVPLLL
jgi:hypothetical protein